MNCGAFLNMQAMTAVRYSRFLHFAKQPGSFRKPPTLKVSKNAHRMTRVSLARASWKRKSSPLHGSTLLYYLPLTLSLQHTGSFACTHPCQLIGLFVLMIGIAKCALRGKIAVVRSKCNLALNNCHLAKGRPLGTPVFGRYKLSIPTS
jgi:hypothetical protein